MGWGGSRGFGRSAESAGSPAGRQAGTALSIAAAGALDGVRRDDVRVGIVARPGKIDRQVVMGQTLLLTGRPGIGKTTVIKAVAELLGNRAGGLYTEEVRSPGGRRGFRLVTLDGQEAVMAHVNLRGQGRPRVGRYGVAVEAIERVGVATLLRAMREGQIVVVDEIGKMELFCGQFKDVVLQAMGGPALSGAEGPHTVVATVMAKPNLWVDGLKALPNVTLWEVTVENRDGLAERVVQWLDKELPRSESGPGVHR